LSTSSNKKILKSKEILPKLNESINRKDNLRKSSNILEQSNSTIPLTESTCLIINMRMSGATGKSSVVCTAE
jgi:hypothetical protein